jgi:predicted ATPase
MGDLIGAGGMGSVYYAFDRLMQKPVALKLVDLSNKSFGVSQTSEHDDPRRLLANEFKVLSALRHPNIISVLDYGFDDQHNPFYTMELLEDTQDMLVYAKTLDGNGKINLLLDVLQGLNYLHRHDVIHNDLKPSNILMSDGHAKILDFGLALRHAPDSQMRGTLGYMSPEMLRGEAVSTASDLYAFGIIMYEMFVGRRPFEFTAVLQYINQVLTTEADVEPLIPFIGYQLAELVSLLLAKNPLERPESAYNVILEITTALKRSAPLQTPAERESFLRSAPFVGRENELAQLEEAYQKAKLFKGSAWIIAGENRVGKTRLMEEVRTSALIDGAIVLKGQALEGGGLSQQIWRDIARRLVLLVAIDDDEASILKGFISDIDVLLERVIQEPAQTVTDQRIIRTMGKIFRRQTRPMLILMEDLQWASDSLELLNHVSRTIRDLPVLIIANYRSDEAPYLFGKLSHMRLMTLKRLNEDEVRQLSMAMLGQVGARPKLVAMLERETEGNLFFMIDVIRMLAQDVLSLENLGDITLPSHVFAHGMLEVTQRRIKRLHLDYHPMLRIAAVVGRNIDIAIMEEIDSEFDPYEWIQACVNASILEFSNDDWRFTHDKLRDGILLSIDPRERPKLHRMVAQAIEVVYSNDSSYGAILIEHWRVAGDMEKEAQYVQMVAEVRMSSGQFRSAEEFFLRALNLISQNNKPQLTIIYLQLAENYTLLNDTENARDYYDKAMLFVDAHSLQMAQLLFGYATIDRFQKRYDRAKTNLYQALELTQIFQNTTWERKILMLLGRCALEQHDYAEASRYFALAADLAEKDGSLLGKAVACNYLGMVAHLNQDFKQAESYYQTSLYLAQKIGHIHVDNLAQLSLALVKHDSGNLESAAQAYLRAYEHAEQSEDNPYIAEVSAHFSRYFFQMGNTPTGLEILQEGLRWAMNASNRTLLAQFCLAMAWWQYQKGNKLESAQLLGAGLSQNSITQLDRTRMQSLIAKLEQELGKEIYTANYQVGKHSSFNQVVDTYYSKITTRF